MTKGMIIQEIWYNVYMMCIAKENNCIYYLRTLRNINMSATTWHENLAG